MLVFGVALSTFWLGLVDSVRYSPAISTTSGVTQGRLIYAGSQSVGLDVYEFLGIPYAEAPIDEKRFAKPQPKSLSPGVIVATKPPSACPQVFGSLFPQRAAEAYTPVQDVSEDCLYLNIWTPRAVLEKLYTSEYAQGTLNPGSQAFNTSLAPLAVMVYIHGGNFQTGSVMAPMFNGSILAAYNNVIVVTIQYRLGALGFAYLGIEEVPGNMGLWDQLEALKWVKANIGGFGGRGDRITVFGQNAGAASATYHMMSPHSADVFQRAILQSGSANSPSFQLTQGEALVRTTTLMDNLINKFCRNTLTVDSPMSEKLICLRQVSSSDIVKFQENILKPDRSGSFGYMQLPFVPVIDGDFVPYKPTIDGKDKRKSVLLGTNADEGSLYMILSAKAIATFPTPLDPNKVTSELTDNDFLDFIKEYFAFFPRNNLTTSVLLQRFIQMHYACHNTLEGEEVIRALSQATGDFAVVCPSREWGDAQSNFSNTFMYQFHHRASTGLWPPWMGVIQGDELPFVFGFPFTNFAQSIIVYTAAEKLLSRKIMTYWTNFAKFGNPNMVDSGAPNGRLLPLDVWPKYEKGRRTVLKIGSPGVMLEGDSVVRDFKKHDCVFWNEFVPTLVNLIETARNVVRTQPSSTVAPNQTTPMYDYYDIDELQL